jgi:hypothetical protein
MLLHLYASMYQHATCVFMCVRRTANASLQHYVAACMHHNTRQPHDTAEERKKGVNLADRVILCYLCFLLLSYVLVYSYYLHNLFAV